MFEKMDGKICPLAIKIRSSSVLKPVNLTNDLKQRKEKIWNNIEQENDSLKTKNTFTGFTPM